MTKPVVTLLLGVLLAGCGGEVTNNSTASQSQSMRQTEAVPPSNDGATEAEIRQLIEQLVFNDGDASNEPIINPNTRLVDSQENAKPKKGEPDDAEKKRQQFNSCQEAFTKLLELKGAAIPILVEHLDDNRQSINFRNHYLGNSVGDACYWNIYFQLQDRPRGYSEYGYSRPGRDGEDHAKPYWEGTPFDDAGGLKEWLEKNKELNYVEMQIACLSWLLEREKKIGASDADSYFVNILPLEIRILERRIENGDDVSSELKRLVNIRDNKLVDQIPSELLPEN